MTEVGRQSKGSRSNALRQLLFAMSVLLFSAVRAPALDATGLMAGDELRRAFDGATLDGIYAGGTMWTESYAVGGAIAYSEPGRTLTGRWTIEGDVFCTRYDQTAGGCWRLRQVSANCFEFYAVAPPLPGRTQPDSPIPRQWSARGWHASQPATCRSVPTV